MAARPLLQAIEQPLPKPPHLIVGRVRLHCGDGDLPPARLCRPPLASVCCAVVAVADVIERLVGVGVGVGVRISVGVRVGVRARARARAKVRVRVRARVRARVNFRVRGWGWLGLGLGCGLGFLV